MWGPLGVSKRLDLGECAGHHRESQREAKGVKLETLVSALAGAVKGGVELGWRTILEGAPPFLLALGVFLETLGPYDWAAAACCC